MKALRRVISFLIDKWHILLVLVVALGVRVFIFKTMHPVVHTDSITFFFLRELDAVRTPGYPLFLELIFSLNDLFSLTSYYFRLVCFVQIFLLGVLNALLICRIAHELTENKVFGASMGIVYNLNYFVVGFEFQMMTETLSITLLLLVIGFYLRLFDGKIFLAILTGCLAVFLLYTRATYLLLGTGLLFLTFLGFFPSCIKGEFRKKYGPALGIFLLVNVLGIGAWSARNKIKYDYFGISSLMPYQLRYYTNPLFERYNPTGNERLDRVAQIYTEELQKTKHSSATVYNFHVRAKKELGLSDSQISSDFLKVNIRLIRDFPWEYLKQVPDSLMQYYKQYKVYWSAGNAHKFIKAGSFPHNIFRRFFLFYQKMFTNSYLLCFLLVGTPLIVLLLSVKHKMKFHGWLILEGVILYNCFVSVLSTNAGINNLRYRQPVEPLILLMFYAAFFLLGKKLIQNRYSLRK